MDVLERVEPGLSLTDRAYNSTRKLLLTGGFTPGERIKEVELAQALGISRGPVREALHLLSREGLVERIAGRGVFVRAYAEQEIRELAEARELLEVRAVRLAARRAQPEEVRDIQAMLDHAGMVIEQTGQYPRNDDFHFAVLALGRNETIAELTEQLYSRLRMMRAVSTAEPERARQALREHQQILEALALGDEEQAVNSVEQHIARGLERMLVRIAATRG